jgi:hypothetical protein
LVQARFQSEQLTADRSNFWKVVERTVPRKLSLFSENELRDCQDYFSKVQSDPTVSPNELIMAAERLTLIRSEIDVRHGDANYRRTQRLAWWAIGLAMMSLGGGIAFAITQILRNEPTRENWPVGAQTLTVATAMAVEAPTPTPEFAQSPDPSSDASLAPQDAIPELTSTPTPTPKVRPRTKHRSQRQTVKKPNSNVRVGKFFRSLFQPKPTQSPSAVRRR